MLGVAFAADGPDRTKLLGSWETAAPQPRVIWTLTANGDSVHIAHTEEGKLSELECNTVGRECKVKDAGKPVKLSMWFNGPNLVMMETRGSDVVKRRFQVNDDGSAMELEVIPIVPQGKPEVVHLTRAATSH